MVDFGQLTAEIRSRVWGTPANFSGFRVLAVLLHGTLVVGVSQMCGVEQWAPSILGRAAITFGIGRHSSIFIKFLSVLLLRIAIICKRQIYFSGAYCTINSAPLHSSGWYRCSRRGFRGSGPQCRPFQGYFYGRPARLRSRYGHYIFALWFLLSSSFFLA